VAATTSLTDPAPRFICAPRTARLRFARCGSNTILERSFATNPLKSIVTRGVTPTCWVYTATYGGGIVGGDKIDMQIEAGAGATGFVSTQASTKVYRALQPATQRLSASVEENALLVVLPDPVVCFSGAHFSQIQSYDLHENANLVMVDWITSGRHAVGERWAFQHYSSRIDVRRAGQRVVLDAVLLEQQDGPVDARLSTFNVFLTAIVTGPVLRDAAAAIVKSIDDLRIEPGASMVAAAWLLPDRGAMLRVAGVSVEQVGCELRRQLGFLTPLLGDDPWSRKW
jgi:urease accessory protein